MIRSCRLSFGSDRVDGSGGACCLTAVANSVPAGPRPYLARCLTAVAKRTGGLSRAVSGRPFILRLREQLLSASCEATSGFRVVGAGLVGFGTTEMRGVLDRFANQSSFCANFSTKPF